MNKGLFSKILPHLIAVLIFLVVSLFFAKPALEGNVLDQHDIVGWKGMAQNAYDYKAKNGHYPLWNSNLFSGMPNYLIIMEGKGILPDLNKAFGLWLPQPINFFFIACICFYILCMALRLRSIVGIFGALAFAFCTYNPVIIAAGHVTKMFAIAYMPLLLAGILLTYEKRYWTGLALATLGVHMQVGANHPQISYYFLLVALAVTIGYLVHWIKRKEWKHMGIALGISAIAAIAGVSTHSLSFLTTSEYSKATMRGGKSVDIRGDVVTPVKTEGLDTSYAFSYSFSIPEPLIAFMPKAVGGGKYETLDENSNVVKKLSSQGVPEANAAQLAQTLPKYWGGIGSPGGVPYIGVLVFLLSVIGFAVLKHPLRWPLLAVSILAVMMSWGKFFPGFNLILFEHLPLYNKFRAPSMTLVIIQLVLPVIAVLTAQRIFFEQDSRAFLKANFKKILYTFGGVTGFLLLLYLFMGYGSDFDRQILANNWDGSGTDTIGRLIISGLKADRKDMFGGQLLRTLGFMALLLGLVWLYLKNILKPVATVIILIVINMIDLLAIDSQYLNEENYRSKDELQTQTATKTPIDEQILRDTSLSYRVFNSGQEAFSSSDYHTSTFHKAVGGYHPAKLRIYQDIMERYLYANPNPQVLNMLNTKYILTENPQSRQQAVIPNPGAYGPCWLVKHVKLVKDDVEALQSIGTTDLRDTAIVQQSFASLVNQPAWDSLSSVSLTKFDNDEMEYAADCKGPQFAVFSEVYYPYGWNAYIDGAKTEYTRANYALRGLSIPAGKHVIKFVFEPSSYKKGNTIAYIGSFVVLVLVLGGFFMAWRSQTKEV